MQAIEIAAALLGLINVALVVRRSIWNYPFGILMVALYFFVFFDAKLYSDALLQIFFLIIQLYGWWNWHRSPSLDQGVAVGRLNNLARAAWLAGTGGACLLWGLGMASFTDAAAPFADAAIAGMSVSAQILQSLRRVESWLLWIAVDLVAVPLFWSRDLHYTSALYFVFLLLALSGLVAWARRVGPDKAAA